MVTSLAGLDAGLDKAPLPGWQRAPLENTPAGRLTCQHIAPTHGSNRGPPGPIAADGRPFVRYVIDMTSAHSTRSRARLLLLAAFGLALASSPTAQAQMFGPRTLGAETIGRNVRPGAATNEASGFLGNPNLDPGAVMTTGLMNPGARFIRGNRNADDFVGRDFGETQAFIGRGGALTVAALRSAINELRPEADGDTNRQQANSSAARKNSVYPPRLQLSEQLRMPARGPALNSPAKAEFVQRLEQRLGNSGSLPLTVRMDGRTAILQGEVASSYERNLAAALASLEPGIDAVQNDLVVIEERDSGPPGPAAAAIPGPEDDLQPPASSSPLPTESLAPRTSPAARQPVVQPVTP